MSQPIRASGQLWEGPWCQVLHVPCPCALSKPGCVAMCLYLKQRAFSSSYCVLWVHAETFVSCFYFEMVTLYSPGWPRIRFIDQAIL